MARFASLIPLATLAAAAIAQPGTYVVDSNKDAWLYPPVGSGFSSVAATFGSPLGTPDPDRLGYYFLSFDLSSEVDLLQGPYDVQAITVTAYLLNSSTFSATNGVRYDPTYDSYLTYNGTTPDTDSGRPISIFPMMFNNDLTAPQWDELLTPVFQAGLYNAEPVNVGPSGTMPISLQSNVDQSIEAIPLAVATTTDTYTGGDGSLRIADAAELTFTLDLTDADTRQFLADELNVDGTLSFVISSLHAAQFMGVGGDDIWPRLGTRESFGLPDPSIQVTLVEPTAGGCSPADITTTGSANGTPDNVVDLSDFSFYLTLWSASDAAADLTTTGSANNTPDGTVDLSDFSFYLTLWSAGCP